MSISRVQEVKGTSSGSPVAATWSQTTAAGNMCLALVTAIGSASPLTVTNAAWTLVSGYPYTNGNSCQIWIFYIPNCGARSGSESFTITGGTVSNAALYIAEYSGLATTSPVDQIATKNSGTSSTPTTNSVTTTVANELLIGFISDTGGTVSWSSPTGSFSIVDSNTTGTQNAYLERIVSATGTYSTGATTNTSGTFVSGLVSFQQLLTNFLESEDGATFIPVMTW